MIQPSLLIKPLPTRYEYFVEYQSKNNQHKAYLFPCDEEGFVIRELMSPKTESLFLKVSTDLNNYHSNGIVQLIVPPQPMIMICSCAEFVYFETEQIIKTRCQSCGRLWHRDKAIKLPQAKRIGPNGHHSH